MTTTGKSTILLAACVILASSAGASAQPPDEMISVRTHRLQMHREGKGTPAVVFDAGITDQFDKLEPLAKRIAEVTQVITYNRAGYARSEPGPLTRDAAREAKELRALLKNASVPGPYVLVGHSLGALNVMMFAALFPQDVAGMVLLDPPPLSFLLGKDYKDLAKMADRMTAQWQAVADSCANATDPRQKARGAFYQAIASEHREMFGATAKRVAGIQSFGEIPLVVMAAGKPNPAFGDIALEYQKYWIEQSRALAGKSGNGTFVLAEGSSHYLYLDVPDLVVQDILSVVNEARARR